MDKDQILDELRRVSAENGGRPPGRRSFENATGITSYEWERHWARFGDAVREAGLEANALVTARPEVELLEALAGLTQALGKIPTHRETALARSKDPTFPGVKSFERLGRRRERIMRLRDHCRASGRQPSVVAICEAALAAEPPSVSEPQVTESQQPSFGFVYLVRGHPGEYKIGRTTLVDRRLSELGVTASVEQVLVHYIKTDDPPGVESYWHNRFDREGKRMRGEWFRLRPADVAAFKRWRRIA